MNVVLLFLVGIFFANGIPHFVHGVSGKRFPSPFAKPPGRGLSSAWVNALWGLLNFSIALALYKASGEFSVGMNAGFIAFAAGFAGMAVMLAVFFTGSEKEP